jgi:hypothetical protein
VDTAGVVADHAADGATVVAGGIGSEGQMMFFGGVAEVIEDNAGLDARDAPFGIDLENVSHVLGEIEHDGDIAALSCERGSTATAKERSAEVTTNGDGSEDIVRIARKNYADGNLAIVRAVSGVESAASIVEADVTTDAEAQGFGKPRGIAY